MSISAKVICDSISPNKVRLTTLELKFHRFILPEFNTHRMFSRNASSSRAIPIQKMIDQVKNFPAMPIHWGKNQPGMQAGEEINKDVGVICWNRAAYHAVEYASKMADRGYHKQIVNRILEPFQWIKVIVTATEWDNFFNLRDHLDAQPEIRELASHIKEAMWLSTPVELKPGEWHLPFGFGDTLLEKIKTSVAGAARISYNNHDGSNRTVQKDIELHDQLLISGHMSPFEHQATPMERNKEHIDYYWEKGVTHMDKDKQLWSSNFKNWIQYRNLL